MLKSEKGSLVTVPQRYIKFVVTILVGLVKIRLLSKASKPKEKGFLLSYVHVRRAEVH
jgi:hypothetical protein